MSALQSVPVAVCGAGLNQAEAAAPAVFETPQERRMLVFSFGEAGSGIQPPGAAAEHQPGVNWLPDLSHSSAARVAKVISLHRRSSDRIVLSIHWGRNWGYRISPDERQFAHHLIDEAGVDLVHGHSSHHVKGIEVYRDRLILYGCGDFLTDYEGISGYESFRGDLAPLYFASLDPSSGRLIGLQVMLFRMHQLRLRRANSDELTWFQCMLDREGAALGTRVRLFDAETLQLQWNGGRS